MHRALAIKEIKLYAEYLQVNGIGVNLNVPKKKLSVFQLGVIDRGKTPIELNPRENDEGSIHYLDLFVSPTIDENAAPIIPSVRYVAKEYYVHHINVSLKN